MPSKKDGSPLKSFLETPNRWIDRLEETPRYQHLLLIAVLIAIPVLLYYLGDLPWLRFGMRPDEILEGEAYHELCLVLMLPATVLAALVFRIRGAVIVGFTESVLILPHAGLYSPYPDPFFREVSFGLISVLLGGFIGSLVNSRASLSEKNVALSGYTSRTISAHEAERQHLARELHDETAQGLVTISHQIDAILEAPLSQDTEKELSRVRRELDELLDGTRRFIHGLRPPLLEELGLSAALRWLGEQFEEKTGSQVAVISSDSLPRLSSETELTLFRIVQEALSNVEKHASASHVTIRLESHGGFVRAKIVDDGVGFAFSPDGPATLVHQGRFGLVGITERARLARGTSLIESEPGKGTAVTVEVPSKGHGTIRTTPRLAS